MYERKQYFWSALQSLIVLCSISSNFLFKISFSLLYNYHNNYGSLLKCEFFRKLHFYDELLSVTPTNSKVCPQPSSLEHACPTNPIKILIILSTPTHASAIRNLSRSQLMNHALFVYVLWQILLSTMVGVWYIAMNVEGASYDPKRNQRRTWREHPMIQI